MRTLFKMPVTLFAAALFSATSALGDAAPLPERETPRPRTTDGVPHVQIGIKPIPALSDELLRRVALFPGVKIGATRVSLPGAAGFQLEPGFPIARPKSIVGGREFAHLHPDGSLHASLSPEMAIASIAAGWAIAHPWADERPGWEGFVMIYTPQSEPELETVFDLVQSSYEFVTGQEL